MRIRGYTHRLDAQMVRGSNLGRKPPSPLSLATGELSAATGREPPIAPRHGLRAVLERFGIGHRQTSVASGTDF